jgi:hypothetical protein
MLMLAAAGCTTADAGKVEETVVPTAVAFGTLPNADLAEPRLPATS